MIGTVSMGVRAPIIRQGDDLAAIVVDSIQQAIAAGSIIPRDRDVVAMTEAIVARA
jgi:F420-0:gamma-glutamyl ligase